MPRTSLGTADVFARALQEYPEVFRCINKELICVLCDKKVTSQRFWNVQQHLRSQRHKDLNHRGEDLEESVVIKQERVSGGSHLSDVEENGEVESQLQILRTIARQRHLCCLMEEELMENGRNRLNFSFGVLDKEYAGMYFMLASEEHDFSVSSSDVLSFFERNVSRLGEFNW